MYIANIAIKGCKNDGVICDDLEVIKCDSIVQRTLKLDSYNKTN